MIEKAPIRFVPYLKKVIWGGEKICKYKSIEQPDDKIGESWEISAVQGFESVVAEGSYKGMRISELIGRFGAELLGEEVFDRYDGRFPLLVKYIDANDNLSVQVHPDDELARKRHGSLGKTEVWYILDVEEDSKIYSGFNRELTPEEFVRMVEDNSIEKVLAVYDSHPGDVFFLPAGRVHSIGAGNLLVEVQESSDITYRIYDYDRRDAEGNLRELHTEHAKDAIDYTFHRDYGSARTDPDLDHAVVAECEHFKIARLLLDGEKKLAYDAGSFTVLMCLDGECSVEYEGDAMPLKAGDTVLMPAMLTSFTLKGRATLLTARS